MPAGIASSSVADVVCKLTSDDSVTPWFCFATDGSSDEEDKYFPILLRHWDGDRGVITTSFVDMPAINIASGAQIYDSITQSLASRGISWKNCAAYSSDNASVMTGVYNSLLSRIRKEAPAVFQVGCPCHLAHLAAENGSKALSVTGDEVLIDIYNHFDKSVKRKEGLREYLEFTGEAVRKVLKHVTTRWLSLGKCLERLLHMWSGLKSYFLSRFESEDDEPPRKKRTITRALGNREARLVQYFKDPMTKIYILFLHSVMPAFDSFNTLLQSEEPCVHLLQPQMMALYKTIITKLVKTQVIIYVKYNDAHICHWNTM